MSTRSQRMREEALDAYRKRMENKPPAVDPTKPLCICGSNLVKRFNGKTQKYFMGCRTFPVCKHTSPYINENI